MAIAAPLDASLTRRLVTLGAGLLGVAVGVALMITGEIGVAPYDVLTTGLAESTGLQIGIAAMVLPLVFTVIGWALGGRVGPGTAIAVLVVGPVLGIVLELLPDDIEPLAPRIALFGVGFAVLALGITAVVVAEIGAGPAELVMLAISQRGFPLAPVRTAIEVASVAVGWAMGGQVGAGTIVVAVLIGPALRRLLTAAGYDQVQAERASNLAAPGA